MLTAITRYGVRVPPHTDEIIERCTAKDEVTKGPLIQEFEHAFQSRHGSGTAIATSYGRMAFFHILRALDLPPGSEIVVPALTFWVIPELARQAGLRPVFADINPDTFTLDPDAFARAITPNTRAVVPTHLYGLPCDMDPIMSLARQHNIAVIEDCAHALGATYRGRPVGTFGDGALFSFQTIKPLNAFGGGMALVKDPEIAASGPPTGGRSAMARPETDCQPFQGREGAAHLWTQQRLHGDGISNPVGDVMVRLESRRVPVGKN